MKNRDEKLKEYIKISQSFLPGIKPSRVSSFYNPTLQDKPSSGYIELSDLFFNEKSLQNGAVQFIHYTSVTSAMNILNSGNVRFYNCLNLNDPLEIEHLLEKSGIDFTEEEIKDYQREHFILSGSLFNSIEDEDFNLWRLYGDSGRGIGIVFEVNENAKKWNNLYFQKVKYEDNEVKNIYDYFEFHKQFNEEHQLFENKPDFFALLATGVKNKIWSIENEFRAIINLGFEEFNLEAKEFPYTPFSKSLKHEYKSDGRLVSYIEFPIYNNQESRMVENPFTKEEIDLRDYKTFLKVKKLILGPNSSFTKLSDFMDYEHWIKRKMKYDFEVELSRLVVKRKTAKK
jgi:hypothetical protein